MRRLARSVAAYLTVVSLLLWIAPAPALAAEGGARIEGLLIGVEGRPARDMRVHLIDAEGHSVATSATSEDGLYSFKELEAGSYSLGIENADGQMAPVASNPIELGENELARRDLKLLETDSAGLNAAAQSNYCLGVWWAGLSPAAKTWTIVAILAVAGITWSALDSTEKCASPPCN